MIPTNICNNYHVNYINVYCSIINNYNLNEEQLLFMCIFKSLSRHFYIHQKKSKEGETHKIIKI